MLFTADWPYPFSGLSCTQVLFYGGVGTLLLWLIAKGKL
jgi:hypothetical protein